MNAKIPKVMAETNLSRVLEAERFKRLVQGKSRDIYELQAYPQLLLIVATDRVSVFDIVLNGLVPDKGKILTLLSGFWFKVLGQKYTHHLVAFGEKVNDYLPLTIRNAPELLSRALVVRRLEMIPVEAVVRGYLVGTGFKEYQETGMVAGRKLPANLQPGANLEPPIFHPTTKSKAGHDVSIPIEKFRLLYGERIERLSILLYQDACAHAEKRGVIIADTKFEFGWAGNALTLADEVLTPDSSRFWEQDRYNKAMQQCKLPPALDKQYVRDYCESLETPFRDEEGKPLKFSKLDPTQEGHLTWAWSVKLPQKVIDQTGELYRQILSRLTE